MKRMTYGSKTKNENEDLILNFQFMKFSIFNSWSHRASPRDATLSPLHTPHIRHASWCVGFKHLRWGCPFGTWVIKWLLPNSQFSIFNSWSHRAFPRDATLSPLHAPHIRHASWCVGLKHLRWGCLFETWLPPRHSPTHQSYRLLVFENADWKSL